MNFKTQIIHQFILALTFGACTYQNTQNQSQPKWAVLDPSQYPHTLLHKTNGSTIKICATPGDPHGLIKKTAKAISKWGKAIQRTYIFKRSNQCRGADIKIVHADDPDIPIKFKQSPCTATAIADTQVSPMVMYFCQGFISDMIILHETGHLFSLCDFLGGKVHPKFINYCQTGNGRSDGGIMDAFISSNPREVITHAQKENSLTMDQLQLSADDIDGVKNALSVRGTPDTQFVEENPDCNPERFGNPGWGLRWGNFVKEEPSRRRCKDSVEIGDCLPAQALPKGFEKFHLRCQEYRGLPVWSCHKGEQCNF